MKQFLITLLVLALSICMVACGGTKITNDNDDSSDSSVSSEASGDSSASSDISDDSSVSSEVGDDSSSEDDGIAGKYMLYSMVFGDEVADYSDIVEYGMEGAYLELLADGTFVLDFGDGDVGEGTYDAEAKTITAAGESINFTIDGDYITLTGEDFSYVFTKGELPEVSVEIESSEEESSNDEPVEEDSSDVGTEEDNNVVGKYIIYSMTFEGETYPADEMFGPDADKYYIELFADGTFVLDFGEDAVTNGTYDTTEMTLTAEGEAIKFSVAGNTLTMNAEHIGLKYTFKK